MNKNKSIKSLLIIFFVLIIVCYKIVDLNRWQLIWSDEFESTTIDETNWTHDIGYGPNNDGWGLWGMQEYTNDPENSYIKNGKLVLKAFYYGGDFQARNYTSAKLTTFGKRSFKYGKISAKIKMPFGKGIFPAFWMLGNNIEEIGWPKCGEIDIVEMFGGGQGKDDTLLGTIHYFDDNENGHTHHGDNKTLESNLSDDFHVYAIEWSEKKIIWTVDGKEYHRESIDVDEYPERSELHNKAFILVNLAIGAWVEGVGYPNETTIFPQQMEIDWIRVYKKNSLFDQGQI